MNRQYRQFIRNTLFGGLLSLLAFNVMAQEIEELNEEQDDYLTIQTTIPGRLFPATEVTNTGATSTVAGDVLYKTPTANLTNTVTGIIPGLFAVQGNGEPRWGDASWFIRGIGTYSFSGDANIAKYYVDGFEVLEDYINFLSPSEIGSISILKDAAALSTFGMRGANGVVWIETKRGEEGKPKVNIQMRSGVQSAINILKPLKSNDFANLYNQAISNDNGMVWTPTYTSAQLDAYKSGRGTDVDWYKEALKDQGYYSDLDLSFHGGTNLVRYRVVLGYANQQGLFNAENTDQTSNTRFARYNMRTNLDINLFKILEASIDVGGRLQDWNRPNFSTSTLMNNLARYPSNIYPVYDEIAKETDPLSYYSGTTIYPQNPVASINGLGWTTDRLRIMQANFKFKENLDFLLDGLYLQQSFSFYVQSLGSQNRTKNYARYFNGERQTTDESTTIVAGGLGSNGMEEWKQGTLTAGYGNSSEVHEVNAALNLHISDYKGNGLFGYQFHYLNYNGKVNYAYNKKYVAELGFSYFGSDAYAPSNKFGFYPALSAAWVVSNESFLESNEAVDFLKIRASAGKTGGAESYVTGVLSNFGSDGRYLYQQYYSSSQAGSHYTGNSAPFSSQGTFAPLFLVNENVFSEKSIKYNAGLDLNLFKKIDFSVDVFLDKRSDILTYDNTLMNYYGINTQFNNIGKMTNKGFEASLAYHDKVGDMSWSLFGMAFYAKNIVDFMAEVTPAEPYMAQTGKAYGTRMGLEAVGYYQLSDFNADGSLKTSIPEPMFGAVQPGDLRYKDMNNDGYVDQLDIAEIGPPSYPKWNVSFGGSLAYKSLDFSLFFRGAAGASINLLNYSNQMMAFVNNGNAYEWAKNAWAYYPEQGIDTRASATYPRLTTLENNNNYRASSFWIRNNDFLRLKNIEIGYDFSRIINYQGISKLRLYANALNPLTISNVLKDFNMDPESGLGYPALKSYNIGVQINF